MGQLSSLLQWHQEDPPSDEERARNEAVQTLFQGNRNPFVDLPQLAWLIFDELGVGEALSDCGWDNATFAPNASWSYDDTKLVLTVQRPLAVNETAMVVIASALALPSAGLVRNDSTLLVETDAAGGLSMPRPVVSSTTVGVFEAHPTLKFLPTDAKAGERVELRLNVSMAVNLSAGDVLELALPGFMDGILEEALAEAALFAGGGDSVLPAAARAVDVYINWTETCETRCNETCISACEAAGGDAGCNSTNTTGTNVTNATVCSLTDCHEVCVDTGTASEVFTGLLNATANGLVLRFSAFAALVARGVEQLIVPLTAGVALPLAGTPARSHNVSLALAQRTFNSCVWNEGENPSAEPCITREFIDEDSWGTGAAYARATPVHVPNVGSLGDVDEESAFAFDYLPHVPSAVVDVVVTFLPTMALRPLDTLYLHLPGFTHEHSMSNRVLSTLDGVVVDEVRLSNSSNSSNSSTVTVPDKLMYVAWVACPPDTLMVTLHESTALESGLTHTLIVPSALGVRVPPYPLMQNSPEFLHSTDAAEGTVSNSPIPISPALISLGDTPALSFFPAVPGGVANLRFDFTPQLALNPGDRLVLLLPGFVGPEQDCFSTLTSSPNDAATSAAWNATTSELTVRVTNYLKAYERVSVVISTDSQIKLPVLGVYRNDARLQIAAKSQGGALDYSGINTVQPIGVFQTGCAISFEGGADGSPVSITVTVVAGMALRPGESVTLILTGLEAELLLLSATPEVRCISTSGASDTATFNTTSKELVMYISRDVEPFEQAIITVPSEATIRLPSSGLPAGIQISGSTDASDGPIAENVFVEYPPTGALANASLDASDETDGSVVSLALSFTPLMQLSPGDAFVLELPGFEITPLPDDAPPANTTNITGPPQSSEVVTKEVTVTCDGEVEVTTTVTTTVTTDVTAFPNGTWTQTKFTQIETETASVQGGRCAGGGAPINPGSLVRGEVKVETVLDLAMHSLAWSNSTLSFVMGRAVPNGTVVSMRFFVGGGLRLARNAQADLTAFTISTNCSKGPISNHPVDVILPASSDNSFVTMPELTLEADLDGRLVTATAHFALKLAQSAGAEFVFELPGLVWSNWTTSMYLNVSNILRSVAPNSTQQLVCVDINTTDACDSENATDCNRTLSTNATVSANGTNASSGNASHSEQNCSLTPIEYVYKYMMTLEPATELVFIVSETSKRANFTGAWTQRAECACDDSTFVNCTCATTGILTLQAISDVPSDGTVLLFGDQLSIEASFSEFSASVLTAPFTLAAGGVPAVLRVQPIGRFDDARITALFPGMPAEASSIDVSFKPSFEIRAFENITLALPGFLGEPGFADVLEGPDGARFAAAWLPDPALLVLYVRCAGSFVAAGESVALRVPASLGVILPPDGLTIDEPSLTISASGRYGVSPAVRLHASTGAGTFTETLIDFSPPRPDSVAKVIIKGRPLMDLQVGSTLSVFLPAFTGANHAAVQFTSHNRRYEAAWAAFGIRTLRCSTPAEMAGSTPCGRTLSFDEVLNYRNISVYMDTPVLTITFLDKFPRKQLLELVVPSWLGIALPAAGLRVNQPTLRMQSNTPNSPMVTSIAFHSSPGVYVVGGFLYFTIDFAHSRTHSLAGRSTDTTVEFQTIMSLSPSDVVTLTLPGFTFAGGAVSIETVPAGPFETEASWNAATSQLVITMREVLAAETPITILIREGEELKLPVTGIPTNYQSITISTDAAAGAVSSQAITTVPAILGPGAALVDASLSYRSGAVLCEKAFGGRESPGLDTNAELPQQACAEQLLPVGRAATATEITLSFQAGTRLYPSDAFELAMPGFIVNTSLDFVPHCSPSGRFRMARFDKNTSHISFAADEFVDEGEVVTLVFPSSLGIKLPLEGLQFNEPRITLKTNASFGPVAALPVHRSPGIGTFGGTPTLSFRGTGEHGVPSSSEPVEITLRFTAFMEISNFEVITLHLPGFTGQSNGQVFTTSLPIWCGADSDVFGCGYKIATASWDLDKSELVMTVKNRAVIGVGEEITIKVSSLSGIRLPEEGIASNSLIPTISTDALAGGVGKTQITSVQHVSLFAEVTRELSCDLENECPFPWSTTTSDLIRPIVRFDPPQAAVATAITLEFVSSVLWSAERARISAGDTMNLKLTGFGGNLVEEVVLEGPYANNFEAVWDPVRGDLSMLVLAELPEEELISVTIPIDKNFIIIPEDGLPQGSLETPSVVLTIEIPDEIATLIAVTAGIGKLADTTLSYTTCPIGPGKPLAACPECDGVLSCPCRTPGAPTQLSFSLKNSMRLVPGDVIVLILPGFSGASGEIVAVSSPPGKISAASWDLETTRLAMTLTGEVCIYFGEEGCTASTPFVPLRVEVPIELGVTLPTYGAVAGDERLKVELEGRYGVVIPSPIAFSDTVESLISQSTLRFEPPTPDSPTTLVLVFRPLAPRSKQLDGCSIQSAAVPGDWVAMTLPGFQYFGDAAVHEVETPAELGITGELALSMPVISVPSGSVVEAYWFNGSKILYAPIATEVPEDSFVLLQLLSASGLRSPEAGLLSNDPSLTIEGGLASVGHIPKTSITEVQAIQPFGTVQYSSISFNPPSRTEVVELILTFSLSIPIIAGEYVTFTLDSFSMDYWMEEGRTIAVTSEPSTCFENPPRCIGKVLDASWNPAVRQLRLRLSRDLPAFERTTVWIPVDIGFRVPEKGITSFEEKLTLEVNTPQGIIPATPVEFPQPIGFFLQMPYLSYSPAAGARPTEMKISFQTNTVFERHEIVRFYLQNFAASYYHTGHIVNIQPYCKLGKALWRDGQLKVTLGHSIDNHEKAEIIIPPYVGLELPKIGIPEEIPASEYNSSIQGITGAILSESFGAIWDVTLCLPDAKAAVPGETGIAFNLSMPLDLSYRVAVYLPGFQGPTARSLRATMFSAKHLGCAPASAVLLTPPPIGSWDAETSIMSFTITQSVEAYQYLLFFLEAGGVQISPLGLPPNFRGFHVTVYSADAVLAIATPVGSVPGVGVFEDTALCFAPSRAGEPADISVQFRLRAEFIPGDEVSVELPNFFSEPCEGGNPADCPTALEINTTGTDSPLFARGLWLPLSVPPVVKFYAAALVTPGRLVRFTLPAHWGIRLPETGMPTDWDGLTIATNASSGPVLPVNPLYSCPVGSLNGTETLEFLRPIAGATSGISFSFTTMWDIEKGAHLKIYLEGMLLAGYSTTSQVIVPAFDAGGPGLVSTAKWRGSDWSFEFIFGRSISSGESVRIEVPEAAGLRVDPNGVLRDQESLQWSLGSTLSPVERRSVRSTGAVGLFLGSAMSFAPAAAAAVARSELQISFSLSAPISIGEYVALSLPGFTKAATRSCEACAQSGKRISCPCFCTLSSGVTSVDSEPVLDVADPAGFFTNATWSEIAETLTFVAQAEIPGGFSVQLIVGESELFWLPLEGLTVSNRNLMLISTNAILGPVLPIALEYTMPVGSFQDSTVLRFAPAVAGAPTALIFEFTPQMTIAAGEELRISLPGFTGQLRQLRDITPNSKDVSSSPPGAVRDILWMRTSNFVNLVMRTELPAGMAVQITIASSIGITLPEAGLMRNDPAISVSSNSRAGPVPRSPASPVACTMGVCRVLQSGIMFDEGVAAAGETGMTFDFAISQHLLPDDAACVLLPGFGQKCASCPVNGTVQGADARLVWNGAVSELCVVIATDSELAPEELVSVSISKDQGFLLPATGVPKLGSGIALRVVSTACLSDPVPFGSVDAVGSFTEAPCIKLDPPVANVAVNFSVCFEASMQLAPGDLLFLSLPGFAGPHGMVDDLGGSHGHLFTGFWEVAPPPFMQDAVFWDSEEAQLVLVVTADSSELAAGRRICVGPQLTAGFNSPPGGMLAEDVFTLRVQAADGAVRATPMCFAVIGSLGADSSIEFAPAVAGAFTRITVNFTVPMGMVAGEQCTLNLPAFDRDCGAEDGDESDCANLVFQDLVARDKVSLAVSWLPEQDSGTPQLVLTALEEVLGDVRIALPAANRIRLPAGGVTAGDPQPFFDCVTSRGRIEHTEVVLVQPVGRFLAGCSLGFSPALSSAPTQLSLEIQSSVTIELGEALTLGLPGFTLVGTSEVMPVMNSPFFKQATWHAERQELRIVAVSPVQALERIMLKIPALSGLALPATGIREGGGGVMFASDAAAGPVQPGGVCNVQPVGAFLRSRLSFEPPVASKAAVVKIALTPAMPCVPGETIRVDFEGFGAVLAEPQMTDASVASAAWLKRQMFPQKVRTSVLFTLNNEMKPGVETVLNLEGLQMPYDGVGSSPELFALSVACAAGSFNNSRFSDWQLVGSFTDTPAIQFPLPPTGEAVLIVRFSYAPKMRQVAGDEIRVQLGGFSGTSASGLVVENAQGIFSTARWDDATSDLIFVIAEGKEVKPNEIVLVNVPYTPLTLPPGGVDAEQGKFMKISTNSTTGPVLPVPFSSFVEVNALQDTAISFDNPVACGATGITVAFKVSSRIAEGDTIRCSLPGFSSDLGSRAFFTQSAQFAKASWSAESSLLTFTSTAAIDESDTSLIEIGIGANAGIALPCNGVRSAGPPLSIRSLAAAGPTLAQPFETVQLVGTFGSSPVLNFVEPAGVLSCMPADIVIKFVAKFPLRQGETVRVELPGFIVTDESSVEASGFDASFPTKAELTPGAPAPQLWLTVVPELGVPADQLVSVQVSGVSVPCEGIREPQASVRIATDATEGPVLPVALTHIDPVGAVQWARLEYGRPISGESSSIVASFVPRMSIDEGQRVRLHLPLFRRGSNKEAICPAQPGAKPFAINCTWTESSRVLTVTTAFSVKAGDTVTLEVPATSGIRLPFPGISINDPSLKLEIESAAGRMNPTSIGMSPALGSLSATALDYVPGLAGSPARIDINFSYVFEFAKGDTIQLYLPQFFRGGDAPDIKTQSGAWYQASWSEALRELTLTCTAVVPAGTLSQLSIDRVYGISIPKGGTMENNPLLMIGTSVTQGPVLPFSIARSPAVGAFGDGTRISFEPKLAGQPSEITLTFRNEQEYMGAFEQNPNSGYDQWESYKYDPSRDDVVTVLLPGFGMRDAYMYDGETIEGVVPSEEDPKFWAHIYVCTDDILEPAHPRCGQVPMMVLELFPLFHVGAGTLNQVQVPLELGVELPPRGVPETGSGIALGANTAQGAIVPAPIQDVQGVGAVRESHLVFAPLLVGPPVELDLMFSLWTAVAAGEVITLHVPGFRGEAFQDGPVASTPAYVSSAAFDPAAGLVHLRLAVALPPSQEVRVVLSPERGIVLPAAGVDSDSALVQLSSLYALAQFSPTRLTSITGVAVIGPTRWEYEEEEALGMGELLLSWTHLRVRHGDVIKLALPGFSAEPANGVVRIEWWEPTSDGNKSRDFWVLCGVGAGAGRAPRAGRGAWARVPRVLGRSRLLSLDADPHSPARHRRPGRRGAHPRVRAPNPPPSQGAGGKRHGTDDRGAHRWRGALAQARGQLACRRFAVGERVGGIRQPVARRAVGALFVRRRPRAADEEFDRLILASAARARPRAAHPAGVPRAVLRADRVHCAVYGELGGVQHLLGGVEQAGPRLRAPGVLVRRFQGGLVEPCDPHAHAHSDRGDQRRGARLECRERGILRGRCVRHPRHWHDRDGPARARRGVGREGRQGQRAVIRVARGPHRRPPHHRRPTLRLLAHVRPAGRRLRFADRRSVPRQRFLPPATRSPCGCLASRVTPSRRWWRSTRSATRWSPSTRCLSACRSRFSTARARRASQSSSPSRRRTSASRRSACGATAASRWSLPPRPGASGGAPWSLSRRSTRSARRA